MYRNYSKKILIRWSEGIDYKNKKHISILKFSIIFDNLSKQNPSSYYFFTYIK